MVQNTAHKNNKFAQTKINKKRVSFRCAIGTLIGSMPRPLKLPLLQLLLFSCLAMQHCGTALPSTVQPAATGGSTTRTARTTPELSLESTTQRSTLDLVNAETDGSGWETLETEFKLATHSPTASTHGATAPTSIEQQDQPPAIPATTLAFANAVAVAGDTMDSTGLTGDATPPYAAVDDSYGN